MTPATSLAKLGWSDHPILAKGLIFFFLSFFLFLFFLFHLKKIKNNFNGQNSVVLGWMRVVVLKPKMM
jgi:hypothetical protein